jgi:hypothetical protein
VTPIDKLLKLITDSEWFAMVEKAAEHVSEPLQNSAILQVDRATGELLARVDIAGQSQALTPLSDSIRADDQLGCGVVMDRRRDICRCIRSHDSTRLVVSAHSGLVTFRPHESATRASELAAR